MIGRYLDGKFLLRALIGDGATGRVYCAKQVTLNRCVAVKVLHPELSQQPAFVARFRTEALAASRLSHPNVVGIIDLGRTSDDVSFIAMELVRGHTLREVSGGVPQPPARVGALVSQVLDALGAAHGVGVVHADVKGENILVRGESAQGCGCGGGHGDTVKVLDFGIASIIPHPMATRASTSFLCGTPGYIAPEVILGEPTEPAADIYAVGVMLYELLTGEPPYRGDTAVELLSRHVHDPLIPPSALMSRPGISPRLDAIVCRALAKRPEDRYVSATALCSALLDATRECDLAVPVPVPATAVTPVELSHGSTWAWDPAPALDLPLPELDTPATGSQPRLPESRVASLYEAVGSAIRSGNRESLVERYLDLVAALAVAGDDDAALRELDEAIDIVTGGLGPDSESAPPIAWRLLDQLADRRHQRGELRDARLASLRALRLAKRGKHGVGQRRSEERLARLDADEGCDASVRRPATGAM